MEQTHAEQNKEHYNAVRTNPMYSLEGMMDVLREDFYNAMTYPIEVSEYPKEVIEPEWTRRQWDAVQQVVSRILHVEQGHYEDQKKIDKLEAKVNRGTKQYKY